LHISLTDAISASESVVQALTRGERLELSREVEAELGKRSTYYLAKYIIGYDKLNDKFHVALCRFIDKHLYEPMLILAPRGHYKTTCKTITGITRMILRDPDISTCIMFNTMDNATIALEKIRNNFVRNDKFRALYPEHATKTKREEGRFDSFITPARKKLWKPGGTVDIAGADRAVVSRHYDFVQFDDLVDNKNVTTADQRKKVYSNYSASLSVIDRETSSGYPWHHIVGTRWSFDDMYSNLLEENRAVKDQGLPGFNTFITKAYFKTATGETEFLFPEEFTQRRLDILRAKQGDYLFSCLYLNDPSPEDRRSLDPVDIRYYDPKTPMTGYQDRCITVDPATSLERDRGDPSVIGVYSMDADANLRCLDLLRGWWDPDELISRIIDMHKKYKINKVGFESVNFSSWGCHYLEKERKRQGLPLRVIPIKRGAGEKKKVRLDRIIPYHRTHKILWRRDDPELDMIVREHREHPTGRYDDILDTLCDAIEMLVPPAIAADLTEHYTNPPITLNRGRGFRTGYNYG
jgi:predicted phage terminase large subunit-like protein